MAALSTPGQPLPSAVGLGLRNPHFQQVLAHKEQIPWLEVLIDNHLDTGGTNAQVLERVAGQFPLAFHCVGLSLGSAQEVLNLTYLKSLAALVQQHRPAVVSDHLSWSNLGGQHSHDLLPLVYCRQSLKLIERRVKRVQDALGVPLLLENISMYLPVPNWQQDAAFMHEADFLNELCWATGCGILLDVNNLWVNQHNLGWNVQDYLSWLHMPYVKQMHVAGHQVQGQLLIDTHGGCVSQEVLHCMTDVLQHSGPIPVLLEWDNQLPSFEVMLGELSRIQAQYQKSIVWSKREVGKGARAHEREEARSVDTSFVNKEVVSG